VTIKIEKNIPLPKQRGAYPWREMDVGDSFFVAGKTSQQIAGSISHARRAMPEREFVSQTVDGGVRVWRAA
jgi:hypothetical protein